MEKYIFEIAALGAALCWTIGGIIATASSRHLGAFAFTRLRMSQVFVMLLLIVAFTGSWRSVISMDQIIVLALSGLVGIFLGDIALFATLRRIGPRRTAVMFSSNGPISAMIGFFVLGEVLQPVVFFGVVLVVVGVVVVILNRQPVGEVHELEKSHGNMTWAVFCGLLAATGQAAGAVIAKPILEQGVDPFAASLIRVAAAVICLYLVMILPLKGVRAQNPYTKKYFWQTALSGFLGMAIGMSLLLFALKGGKVGVVTTLSSITPVLILPIIWWQTKKCPSIYAWLGALVVVVGSALIFVF